MNQSKQVDSVFRLWGGGKIKKKAQLRLLAIQALSLDLLTTLDPQQISNSRTNCLSQVGACDKEVRIIAMCFFRNVLRHHNDCLEGISSSQEPIVFHDA